MKMSKTSKIIIYALLAAVAVYFLAPFLWLVLTAFKPEAEANRYPPVFLPSNWRFNNFADAWRGQDFNLYLFNSLFVTIMHTFGILLSCSLTAYGFARFRFRGRNVLFFILLMTMMIPWDVTMIPQYMEFKMFGWINSLKALIIPGFMGSAYYIFLLRQFMMGVPKEFEEAAKIDGAGYVNTFVRIFLPILKPPLILVGVLNFIMVWNDYLGPLIFLQDRSKYTLALGLASFRGVHETKIIPILCITIVMIVLPVIVFIAAQKYIVDQKGGGVK